MSVSMQHAEQSSINSVTHVTDMQHSEGALGSQRGRTACCDGSLHSIVQLAISFRRRMVHTSDAL